MAYIDGFVIPILPGKQEAYRVMCEAAAKVFLDHGALQVVENISDDVPDGKVTDFWRAVQADKAGGEQLIFSWIVWPSKEARVAGWERAMADDRMQPSPDMPFDGKRLIFGGFETILDTGDTTGDQA